MVKLQTFLKWGVGDVFDHKVKEIDSVVYVNEIWCKVCAKNKEVIMRNVDVKGATKSSAERFINSTTNITNDAVSFSILLYFKFQYNGFLSKKIFFKCLVDTCLKINVSFT